MRWRLLLVIPLVGILIGPLYARHHPAFLGVAFFYWYELTCMVISGAITMLVFPSEPAPARPVRRPQPAGADDEPRFSRDPSIRRRPSRTLTRSG
jgi:hypothetical protein